MAENDPQQRTSTSLFGSSGNSKSIQEIIRNRQQASRDRRRKLFSWLLPLLGICLVIAGGIFLYQVWQERKQALAQQAVDDSMRGINVFGNEDAALKLEAQLPDTLLAPHRLMTILHRATGLRGAW